MSLAMTESEIKVMDAQVEGMLDWANTRKQDAEQLALDSARLLACTGDRMDRLSKQGFFKRCANRFTGKAAADERANTNDLIQMQKISLRYINMLQEQQLMMAHSMLTLKNNLLSLAIKEEETRNLVTLLAQRTLERFEKLESRVDQLEISTNLQGWLLGLEEREYDERIPTEHMRLFQVINDFYSIKNDAWNYNDLMFMRKAIRTVKLDPKKKMSLRVFIDSLTDEILHRSIGFEKYQESITRFQPQGMDNYSGFVIEQISSPVFVSMHGLKIQFIDRLDVVETLSDQMNISTAEALKTLLRKSIENLHVNLDYEFPLAETAVEILGCVRLATFLATQDDEPQANIPAVADPETIESVPEIAAFNTVDAFSLAFIPGIMINSNDYYLRGFSKDDFDMSFIESCLKDDGKDIISIDDIVGYYSEKQYYRDPKSTLKYLITQDTFYYFEGYRTPLKVINFNFKDIINIQSKKSNIWIHTKTDIYKIPKLNFNDFITFSFAFICLKKYCLSDAVPDDITAIINNIEEILNSCKQNSDKNLIQFVNNNNNDKENNINKCCALLELYKRGYTGKDIGLPLSDNTENIFSSVIRDIPKTISFLESLYTKK
jgi:hypothetical protein